ncbi:uncharacterized protein LOC111287887 [Durio zibethinus]|uniref:Uncharacterized protein LOC111287887 n=1 Tax=Durio zibethinus TaxID=66656 RepID=A0A6P5Y1K9_DURZI|nr:uncharacterized protein LOC111287887 [Durio zibethinus]
MPDTIKTDVSHNVLNSICRHTIGSFLMNLAKFAVESAINVSHKGFTGGKKLYGTFLREKFEDQPTRLKLEDVKLIEQERQLAKMEDMNEVKQQSKTVAGKADRGSEPKKKKKIPQGIKEMELQDPNRKRIFIRSRL